MIFQNLISNFNRSGSEKLALIFSSPSLLQQFQTYHNQCPVDSDPGLLIIRMI